MSSTAAFPVRSRPARRTASGTPSRRSSPISWCGRSGPTTRWRGSIFKTFSDSLDETLKWLQAHKIDVVLVDPQYTASLAADDNYSHIVQAIEGIARKNRVPLVHRYEATRYLADHKEGGSLSRDQFQLNDLGYRCMAEHVARAVTVGLLQPEPSQPAPGASSAEPSTAPAPAE